MSHLLAFPAFSLSHTRWQGCLASYLAALTRYHAIMDAWWFVSTDLAGNYFDLSCGERKERRYCQDFSLSPVTALHLLHGCMLRHETLQTHHVPATLGCGVFGGGHPDFKQKTLKKHRKRDVNPWFRNKCLNRNKAPLFPAEPLGSIVGTNPTLYHMTGPFHHWNITTQSWLFNLKTAKTK